jgi:hypothetical protein
MEATGRIFFRRKSRGARDAWGPKIRPAHVPKEPRSECILVYFAFVKANIINGFIREAARNACLPRTYARRSAVGAH